MKIGLMVGSLRKESYNRKIAEVVKSLLPEDMEADFVEIKDVPMYNPDDEERYAEVFSNLREAMREKDAYLFFIPEYNRSYAPAIKNALDICSVDPKGSPLRGKPAGVFSASMGGMGGMAANHAIRQSFTFLDLMPLQQPEVYLGRIDTLFNEGELVEDTKAFIKEAVDAYVAFAKKILK